MGRLIDGNVLYEKTAEWEAQALHMVEKTMNDEDATEWKRWSTILTERSAFKFDVADAPTVDAVPVVRCKECKWYQMTEDGDMACVKDADEQDGTYFGFIQVTAPEWFCADGERKGGDE